MAKVRLRFKRVPAQEEEEPGAQDGSRPRTLMTASQVTTLRSQLSSDATFRSRMQTAVTQFEEAGGYWQQGAAGGSGQFDGTDFGNSGTIAFAALLACLRRSNDDLGLIWSQSYPWQTYRDRCVQRAMDWSVDAVVAGSKVHPLAIALIYDLLYNDMTDEERSPIATFVAQRATDLSYCLGRWDDQASWQHTSKVACGLASDDAAARVADLLANTQDWAEAREWTAYNSISYEWKAGYPAQQGPILTLYMLKNYGGYTHAQTLGKCIYHLQNAALFLRQYTVPHPGRRPAVQARGNMVAPVTFSWVEPNVASFLLWAFQLLPGHTNLAATADSRPTFGQLASGPIANQATLAASEQDLLNHLYHYWLDTANSNATFANVINYKWASSRPAGDGGSVRGNLFTLFSAVPYLLNNLQLPTVAATATVAGIPKVRRWWPGTLEHTTIRSGFTTSNSSDTLISYWHKRYWVNNYEGSARQNGRWEVHRAGPLLIQRGSASHGPGSRASTFAANGCLTFIDEDYYALFDHTFTRLDSEDGGGVRMGANCDTKAQVEAQGDRNDMGQVTSWHADDAVVAITSNLTRSYNSTTYANPEPGNDVKIASFIREFVCLQRSADGTDNEKIFTYDRVVLADTRWVPKYNLCPATNPTIDGVETPHPSWAPQGAPATTDPNTTWYASGPTRWDYAGATSLTYDNTQEPAVNAGGTNHTTAGTGKVRVTWLRPNGSGVSVTKRGGTNAYRLASGPGTNIADGGPLFSPWHGWAGRDGEWDTYDTPSLRAYNGLYSVEVYPATVSGVDQRFLMACEVMDATDTPAAAAELTCDAGSVAARCGPSAVVFSTETGTRASGNVAVPAGVVTVVLVNLPASAQRSLVASGGLSLTTTSTPTASSGGVVVVGVSGAGTLTFS